MDRLPSCTACGSTVVGWQREDLMAYEWACLSCQKRWELDKIDIMELLQGKMNPFDTSFTLEDIERYHAERESNV